MFSLFDFLTKKRSCRNGLRRVSPPLVGAVLLCSILCNPLESLAYYSGSISWTLSSVFDNASSYYVGTITKNLTSNLMNKDMVVGYRYDMTFTPSLKDVEFLARRYSTDESSNVDIKFSSLTIKSITLTTPGGGQSFVITPGKSNSITFDYDAAGAFKIAVVYDVYWYIDTSLGFNDGTVWVDWKTVFGNVVINDSGTMGDNQALNKISNQIGEQISQDKQFHDEEIEAGNQSGSDAESLVSDLNNVKSKWEILWYPITFTNNLFHAVSGGGAAYSVRSGGITGYRYDNDIGELVPVYSMSRAAPASSGTVLTFPAFTLPVLNVQVWDSYTFDLASVKEQFSVIFDAIYVIFTVVEVVWFVKFLQKKFHEVFG